MKGFTFIELMIVICVLAILGLLAMPGMAHHNNQLILQSQVNSLKWGLFQMPPCQNNNGCPYSVDPSWTGSGNIFTKTFTAPPGTLTIKIPTQAGGSWSCTFSDTSYILRC